MTHSSSARGSRSANALVLLLVTAMVMSTFQMDATAVLSVFLIDEFDLTRSQLGLTFTVSALVGALFSPIAGRFADVDTRRTMTLLFVVSAVGIVAAAGSPSYAVLLVAGLVGGFATSAANPVTNRIVSTQVPLARRGITIGVKQAGPPISALITGLVLPSIAIAAGWRTALIIGAVLSVAGLVSTRFLVEPESALPPQDDQAVQSVRTRTAIRWLTAIGFGISMGNGAIAAFIPLFALEELGLSATLAGAVAAAMGLSGAVGRITWGSLTDRFRLPSTALLIISTTAIVASVSIGFSAVAGTWTLWFGAIAAGASSRAWHAVAWRVIIDRVGAAGVGAASGVLQLGSSIGFAAGPPVFGAIVDVESSYGPAWTFLAVLYLLVTILTIWFRTHFARRRRMEASAGDPN